MSYVIRFIIWGVPGQLLPVSQDTQVAKMFLKYCIIQVHQDASFITVNFFVLAVAEAIYRLQLGARQHN